MKAIIYRDNGGPDVLQLVERDRPTPAPGEVRVRVAVSGVNPTDWQTRSGVAHRKLFSEITPHLDGAGVAPRSAFPHSPHTAHSPSPRTDHAAFTPAYSTARWCSPPARSGTQ
ncbi:hypothetical protein ACWD8I_22010 [Micromonospora arida]|uniref:hypothetical protein n=1 Tax=Micromonospora arida TaxID=2203715 RepID=UPI0033A877F1